MKKTYIKRTVFLQKKINYVGLIFKSKNHVGSLYSCHTYAWLIFKSKTSFCLKKFSLKKFPLLHESLPLDSGGIGGSLLKLVNDVVWLKPCWDLYTSNKTL